MEVEEFSIGIISPFFFFFLGQSRVVSLIAKKKFNGVGISWIMSIGKNRPFLLFLQRLFLLYQIEEGEGVDKHHRKTV